MQSENYELASGGRPSRPKRVWLKRAAGVAVVALAFFVGQAIGSGRIDLHHGVSGNLPAQLDYSSVNQVYRSLKDNYAGKLTETQLIDGLKHGLAESTNDPYTVYFTPKESKDFNGQLNNTFSGIGAQLGQDKDKNLEVMSPLAGYPAAKAGLKAHDIIVEINGTSTNGMSIADAVHKIRGKTGTKVKLKVVRNNSQALNFTITRADIKLPSVKSKVLKGNIGYIQIVDFSNDTASLTKKAAQKLHDQHVKGIILDLRGDPGGYLDAVTPIASLWLPEGKSVVQEKRAGEVIDSYSATGNNILHGTPTVVLIDGGSASASEITAGALHDNHVAYLIGEKSYGKGVVQQLINFGDGSQLKVTVASWYRPNGQNINHKGITPDKTVKITNADAKAGNDTQLQAAEAYLNK